MQRLIRSPLRLQFTLKVHRQKQSRVSSSFFHWNTRPTTGRGLASELRHSFQRLQYSGSHYGFSSGPKLMLIKTIIGLNAAVFGLWTYAKATSNQGLYMTMLQHFTVSLGNISAGRYWTGLTSAFSHMDLIHFAFNMITFNALAKAFVFTPGLSTMSFAALCVGSAAAGSAGFLYDARRKLAGRSLHTAPDRPGLGASGMVMGVVSAAACLMPFVPMNFMFVPVAVPLWATAVLYAGVDLFFLNSESSIIGHAAHLGGGAFGVVYYFAFLRGFGGVAHIFGKGASRYRR